MIKAILCDISGVQITLEDYGFCRFISDKYHIDYNKVEDTYLKYLNENEVGKITEKKFYKLMYKDLNIVKKGDYVKYSNELRMRFIKRIPGTRKVLLKLKKKYRLMSVSNGSKDAFKRLEKKFKLRSLFEDMFFAHQFGVRKGDRKFFENVFKILKLKPAECIYIDDVPKYVNLGKKLGLNTIQFKNVKQFENDLKRYGIRL